MSARGKARKRALDILFESELRGEPPGSTLDARLERSDPPVADYTVELVKGVQTNRERIDELLTTYSEGWTLERMPVVDRNVLRLGLAELLHVEEVPVKVAIDEAVELAKSLSTD
ncbi:MAG TPA: transcription antitermination factor NusB, partial [Cryptosporangiaceae bacterium]|nr:transcription antitermination factor NusB [Cryptosporangiaceae bacterium]